MDGDRLGGGDEQREIVGGVNPTARAKARGCGASKCKITDGAEEVQGPVRPDISAPAEAD